MNCKGQIQQLISFAIILLISSIVVFGSLSVAIGEENTNNANQAESVTVIDNSNLTEEQQKLSSELLGDVLGYNDINSENVYTNSLGYSTDVVDQSAEQLVFVYISLLQGEQTSVIDSYVWNVTSRDEEHSLVAAWVDVSRLEEISSLEQVRNVRTVVQPVVNVGSATTAGDAIHRTDVVRSSYSQNGNGIKIGVISNGVDAISKAQASGDLPSDVVVLSNGVGGNEGIAMMEIIYDMAPGAKLYFHDHGSSVYEFNDAIDELIAEGCTIIVDDITWPDEPFFEDGVVAQHVAEVIANNNIVYISSAGNSGGRHYQGLFEDDGTGYHDKIFTLPAGSSYQLFIQWDDQFGSSANDYDLFVMDKSGKTIAYSTNIQNGNSDPLEWTVTPYLTEPAYIKIKNRDGTAQQRTLEMFIYPTSGVSLDKTNLTSADSIFGHPAVTDAIAVAAISANDQGHDQVESYSSRGPVTITYPTSTTRQKPDLAGVDRVAVTGAGNFGTIFSGTSASAPHIAAVAAQIWGYDKDMSAAEVRSILYESAEDVESSGFDYLSGYGRVDALNVFTSYVNRAPVLAAVEDQELNETESIQINLIATDMDGDDLTYSTDASFGTLTGNVFSWTPTYNDAGTYTIQFSVTDGKYTTSKTATIKVNNMDRAPELEAIDNKAIDENSILEFTVSAIDPDGDKITYSVAGLPSGAAFDVNTGVFSWTPSTEAAGNYQVTFIAEANGLSDSESITITVGDIGSAPQLDPSGNKNLNENELLEFVISATDPEGDAITYSVAGLPEGAMFDTSTRTFIWRPDYNDSGFYSLDFIAEAGNLTDSETVIITVNNVDREPEMGAIGNKVVNENETLSFLISATDIDSDPISYLAVNLPSGANLNNVTGEFSWVPTYSDSGEYNVEFIATSNGLIKSENVVITVNNVDRAPEFAAISDKEADENQLLTFNISATDEDGDIVVYSSDSLPEGALLDSETGDFSWTPGAAGNYDITFIAESNGLTDSQTVTINVLDSAPLISNLEDKDVSSNSITLAWTSSVGVSLVEVYRNGTIIGNVTGSVSEYTDNNLNSDTTYEYLLVPYDISGNKGTALGIILHTSTPSSSNSGGGGSSSSSTTSKKSSSGGGGGGSGSTEDYENIAFKDVDTEYVGMDANVTYEFDGEGNDILAISFHSLKNSGEITSTIEILSNKSKSVSSDSEGIIYKYLNIWVGKSGFATASNIEDARIKFRVSNSWIEQMGVSSENIRLQRYNGAEWEVLPTTLESSTTDYSIFESTTPGFSPFAITAEKVLAAPVSSDTESEPTQIENTGPIESQPEKSNIWTIIISMLAIALLVVGYSYLKNRDN
jgi:PGF-pre-PGF domain-containing protein